MQEIDYLILKILCRNNKPARLKKIHEEIKKQKGFNIPFSTINSSIERLEKWGYVIWTRYYPVRLTEKGLNLSKELIRHAQLLEVFLYNELNLSVEEARIESEKLNLLLSCNIINKICEKYDHPSKCPCGDTILSASSCYCELNDKKLH